MAQPCVEGPSQSHFVVYSVISVGELKCVVSPPVETPSEDSLYAVSFYSPVKDGKISPFLFPSFESYREENVSIM